jgi:drug/metabolite transporter (DMT)-like permease
VKSKPYLAMLIGVLAVSFAAVFIRLADAPPLVIAAYRLTLAAIVLVPFTSVKAFKSLKRLSRRDILLVILASVSLALHFGLWITSLSYTSIASSVVLVTSHPAFVAVISYFLWHERLNKITIGGIVVALAGVVVINYGGFTFGSQAFLGNILALLAGFVVAAYLISGHQLGKRIDILSYLTLIYTFAAVIMLAAVFIMGYSLFGYSSDTYIMLVLLAVVPQLIGHSAFNLAVRMVPVTLVSVSILGEPVGATLLGWLILGETPTAGEIAGGLLILGGIFIVMRWAPEGLSRRLSR